MLKKSILYIKKQEQFRNLIIYGFGQFFNLATPLLVAPYLVYICGEENYGKIGVALALSFFLIVIVDYCSDIIGVKDVSKNRENQKELNRILATTYGAKLILLIITLLGMSVLYCSVPYFEKEQTLFFLSFSILIGQFINPTWFLQGIENFKWITSINIASKVVYVIGVFFCVKTNDDYIFANLCWGIGMILPNAIASVYFFSKFDISFSDTTFKEIRNLIKENFSMFFSQIFLSMQLYSPIILISFFGNNVMAGQYKIVEQIVVMFKTYIYLFFNYMYPRVCFLIEKNIKDALRFWKVYNGGNLIFIFLSMGIVYLFSKEIVTYFNPKEIDLISDLLRFAVLIPFLISISNPLKQLVLGMELQKFYIRLTMIMVAFNLVCMILLLTYLKIYGVIASLVIAEALTIVIYLIAIKSRITKV